MQEKARRQKAFCEEQDKKPGSNWDWLEMKRDALRRVLGFFIGEVADDCVRSDTGTICAGRGGGPRAFLTLSHTSRQSSRTGPDHGRPRRSDFGFARIRGNQAAPVLARNSIKILTRRHGEPRSTTESASSRVRRARHALSVAAPWSSVASVLKASFVAHGQNIARFPPAADPARGAGAIAPVSPARPPAPAPVHTPACAAGRSPPPPAPRRPSRCRRPARPAAARPDLPHPRRRRAAAGPTSTVTSPRTGVAA